MAVEKQILCRSAFLQAIYNHAQRSGHDIPYNALLYLNLGLISYFTVISVDYCHKFIPPPKKKKRNPQKSSKNKTTTGNIVMVSLPLADINDGGLQTNKQI